MDTRNLASSSASSILNQDGLVSSTNDFKLNQATAVLKHNDVARLDLNRSDTKIEKTFSISKNPHKVPNNPTSQLAEKNKISRTFSQLKTEAEREQAKIKSIRARLRSVQEVNDDNNDLDTKKNTKSVHNKRPDLDKAKTFYNLKSFKPKELLVEKTHAKWAQSKKDLIDKKNALNYRILEPFASMKRQRTMLEDDMLPRDKSFYNTDNEGFEDMDLPKNSNSGYYYWIGKDYSNGKIKFKFFLLIIAINKIFF